MSREAQYWVWEQAPVTDPRQLLILISVADVADEHGEGAFPSKSRLARDCRSNERTVQRHLSQMVKDGVLEVEEKATHHRPTTYRIPGVRGDSLTPQEGDRGDNVTPLNVLRGDTGETNRDSAPIYGTGSNNAHVHEQEQGDAQFEQFWLQYPRRIGKGRARKAFQSALRRASFAEVMAGLQAFVMLNQSTDIQYIPHPTTWLNADRWADEIPVVRQYDTTTSPDFSEQQTPSPMDAFR